MKIVAARPGGLTLDSLGATFAGRGARRRLPPIVESLQALGRVRLARDGATIARVAT